MATKYGDLLTCRPLFVLHVALVLVVCVDDDVIIVVVVGDNRAALRRSAHQLPNYADAHRRRTRGTGLLLQAPLKSHKQLNEYKRTGYRISLSHLRVIVFCETIECVAESRMLAWLGSYAEGWRASYLYNGHRPLIGTQILFM